MSGVTTNQRLGQYNYITVIDQYIELCTSIYGDPLMDEVATLEHLQQEDELRRNATELLPNVSQEVLGSQYRRLVDRVVEYTTRAFRAERNQTEHGRNSSSPTWEEQLINSEHQDNLRRLTMISNFMGEIPEDRVPQEAMAYHNEQGLRLAAEFPERVSTENLIER